MRTSGSITLGTCLRPMIEVACRKCGRSGRYHREGLVDRHGPDTALPDLLRIIANCPKHGNASEPCAVVYVGLVDEAAD